MAEEISLGDRKSVQSLLEQRKEEAAWMGIVDKREDKGKVKRIILITKNRLYSLRPGGGKIAREGHWLQLVEIKGTGKQHEANFTFKEFKLNITSEHADEIVSHVRLAVTNAFPGMPELLKYKMDYPEDKLKELPPTEHPLGGFIQTYKSICEFHTQEPREDIVWDMENLFVSGNIRSFNLKEFEQPISLPDLKCLLTALQYNGYFKSLISKNFPLDKNLQAIADALKSNGCIEELVLSRSSIPKDGMAIISDSLLVNKHLTLTTIDISGNPIEDKGMQAFAGWLGAHNKGLGKINVSNCGVGKVGMSAFFNSLKKNVHMASTLTYLDISQNKLEGDGSGSMGAYLATANNAMRVLLMPNTAANLEVVMGAILRGCPDLARLDVSQNKVTKKETGILAKYLQASANLVNVNLSGTGAPVDSIKEIITAITGNVYLKDCNLGFAENKFGVPGARVLASLAEKITNITNLDLSDNEFGDEGVAIFAEGFVYNTALKHLSLDKNFKNKGKLRTTALDNLMNLINSESCPLESLSIAGGPKSELGADIVHLIYPLGTNDSLKSIDISGNQMTNKGAAALSKAIQTNTVLETIKWDFNATTITGFQAFLTGLKRNRTLKNVPLPINDIAANLKGKEAQIMSDLVVKMEQCMLRNQSPTARFFTGQGEEVSYKSGNQFGFLSSGQREEVQKLLFKIKSVGRTLTDEQKLILEDAEQQDTVMANLYGVTDAVTQNYEQEVKSFMAAFVKEKHPSFNNAKQELIGQLMETVTKSVKGMDSEIIKRLQTNLNYGSQDVSQEEWEKAIVDGAAVEITAKSSEVLRSVVNICSDYLYEKMHEKLQDIFDDLNNEAARKPSVLNLSPSGNSPVATSPAPKKAPPQPPKKEAKPAPPPKTAKPTKDGKTEKPAIEDLPKVDAHLEHATKDRVTNDKKRPPTRKRRPAPPGQKEAQT